MITTNATIIQIMREHPGEWMTSDEIVSQMRFGQLRGIGRRIHYMMDKCPQIECRIDELSHKRFYRYIEEADE